MGVGMVSGFLKRALAALQISSAAFRYDQLCSVTHQMCNIVCYSSLTEPNGALEIGKSLLQHSIALLQRVAEFRGAHS